MSLSHLDEKGQIRMVDLTGKTRTRRRALAGGRVVFPPDVLGRLLESGPPKGEFLAAARLAGIQAAKDTPSRIPLTHPIRLSSVHVELNPRPEENIIQVRCEVKAEDATGVEMEALSGVSGAALTLYDMCKSEHKGIRIENVRLLEKEGGKSGDWKAEHTSSGDA